MSEEMTPDIEQFFATGELPDSLKAEAPAPAPAPAAIPVPDVAAAPAATPAPDPAAEMRAIIENERRSRAQLEARLAGIQQQLEQATAPATVQAPDPATDPLGAMMHQMKTIQDNVQSLQTKLTQAEMQNFQQSQFSQFAGNLQRVRDEFAKGVPDFGAAYQHLRQSRMEDLRDVGVTEDQIPNALLQDEIAVAQNAINQGKNPAQVIYNMAKRYGYHPTSAAPTPTPAVTPADKIKQAATVGAADQAPGRAAADIPLTIQGLRDASDADLDKLAKDDKLWRTLAGGGTTDIFHR